MLSAGAVGGVAVETLSAQAPPELSRTDLVLPAEPLDGVVGTWFASCRGRLVDESGAPLAGARIAARVPGSGRAEGLPLDVTRTRSDGSFHFEDLVSPGAIALCWQPGDGYEAARFRQVVTLPSGRETDLGALRCAARSEQGLATPTRILRCVLVAAGEPVGGVLVELLDRDLGGRPPFVSDRTAFGWTDPDGRLALPSRAPEPFALRLHLVGGSVVVDLPRPAGKSRVAGDLFQPGAEPVRLEVSDVRRLALQSAEALDPEARVESWSGGVWRRTLGRCVFVPEATRARQLGLRITIPGHAPRVVRVSAAESLESDRIELPSEFVATTRRATLRALTLVDASGEPLAGRRLVLADVVELAAPQPRLLGAGMTDASGRLRLLVDPDRPLWVFGLDEDLSPARRLWTDGASEPAPFVVRLRDGQLRLDPAWIEAGIVRPDRPALVRRAGTRQIVAVLRTAASVRVAPGAHDISFGAAEPADRLCARVVAGRGVTVTVPRDAEDVRPVVTVRAAKRGEELGGTRFGWRASGGLVAGWLTRSGGSDSGQRAASDGHVTRPSPDTAVVRPAYPGYWRFEVDGKRPGTRWTRWLWLEAGAEYELRVPLPVATSVGSAPDLVIPSFPSERGVAGPRIALVPRRESGGGFTLLHALPELPLRAEQAADPAQHVLRGLAAGRFHLHHHMEAAGSEAWGATPIDLETGRTAQHGELGREPVGELALRIENSGGGVPLEHAIVRVRDPLWQSWRGVLRDGTSLVEAARPLPAPPVTLLRAGVGRLAPVRRGRLLLEVETAEGMRWLLERDVDPGRELKIRLEPGKAGRAAPADKR